jgi:hypothetical protein
MELSFVDALSDQTAADIASFERRTLALHFAVRANLLRQFENFNVND